MPTRSEIASRALLRAKIRSARARVRAPFSPACPLGSVALLLGLAGLGLYLYGLHEPGHASKGLISLFSLIGVGCGIGGVIAGLLSPQRGARVGIILSAAAIAVSVTAEILSIAVPL